MNRAKITYYGAYEGLQEKKYLDRLKYLISQEKNSKYDVSFMLKNCFGGSPLEVCKYTAKSITFSSASNLKKEGRVIAIFDYDFKDEEFIKANKYCEEQKIFNAYSNVNFDLFLLLHKQKYNKQISSNKGYQIALCKAYNIPTSSDIKDEKIIDRIMNQITLDDCRYAIKNAHAICKETCSFGRQFENLEGHFEQPYLKIHLFIEKVLIKCGLL